MKIYIKDNKGKVLRIPAPLSLVSGCLRIANFIIPRVKDHMPEDSRAYVDCIDFNELADGLRYLRKYKGLKLVSVKSSTGEEVEITI
jgi:hypothetical protein